MLRKATAAKCCIKGLTEGGLLLPYILFKNVRQKNKNAQQYSWNHPIF